MKNSQKPMILLLGVSLVTAVVLMIGILVGGLVVAPVFNQPALASTSAQTATDTDLVAAYEKTLVNVYHDVLPSVVNIRVTKTLNTADFGGQLPQDHPEFFNEGGGSGFVWDKQGHIVTNNHVVEDSTKIEVYFADGIWADAQLVAADPDSDLAVIQVNVPANELVPVKVGDSSQLEVGQLAVAIGNPFGQDFTMTSGIVSAVGRTIQGGNAGFSIPEVIQTDAPINPGNSGGVLVNDQGQVVGVTAAIESPVRASAGIGFAIPAAIVNKVVPALIKDGHFDHSWLGVSGVSLYPELADSMKLKSDQHGALVVEVVPGGPADTAGLHGSDRQVEIDGIQARTGGDVITAIDGKPVKTFDDLVTYLAQATTVNQKVSLTVLRQGKEETISVTLAARPKTETSTMPTQPALSSGPHLGIEGVTLTPAIATAMGLKSDQQGVLVERIQTGSAADEAKLNGSFKSAAIDGQMLPVGGDVITKVDGQAVTSVAELQSIISQAKAGQKLTLTVLRDGKSVEVPVTLTDTSGGASQ